MARKKQKQKKRLKKYQGKYVTADRLDMSKGGRVKAQVGGKFAKAPVDSKKTPTMSIEREEEVRPTVQPRTPVQPAVAPKDVPPVTGTKPVQPTPTFTQAPTTGKGSDQMFIGREGDIQPQVKPTVTPKDVTPVTEPEPVKPQITLPEDTLSAQQEAAQKTLKDFELKFGEGKYIGYAPEDFKFFGDNISDAIKKGAINQNTETGWWTDAGYNSAIEALQSGKFTFKDGQWVLKDGTENKEQEIIDEQLITARGRAEQILQGDMTGIPMAEAPKEVEVGELG